MQPYHCIDDGRWAEKRIGQSARRPYAFRSLLDAGATLAFGSDWSVAPMTPGHLRRRHPPHARRETRRLVPRQKITAEAAVRAYTSGSAYAAAAENVKGTIAPGKLADLVLLSDDIFRIDPVKIENVTVRLTVMDGRVVYEANGE